MQDKVNTRTPANRNPWYVLMTLYGEQPAEDIGLTVAAANRTLWNRWVASILSDVARETLGNKGVKLPEADEWRIREKAAIALHKQEMKRRNGADFVYPGFPVLADGNGIDLSYVEFQADVQFDGLVFPDVTHFSNAYFVRDANFAGAIFNDAYFENVRFASYARFQKAVFRGDTSFDESIFEGASIFHGARFEAGVMFSRSSFGSHAAFNGATFAKRAYFDRVAFGKDARFKGAAFSDKADFGQSKFGGNSDFLRAHFGQDNQACIAQFTQADFHGPTSFRQARFHSHYPELSGAVLHDKTEFTADSAYWPMTLQQPPEDAKASCARIRHALAKQGMPDEEHFFFRREMGFSCKIGGFWDRLPYRLFRFFSNFGCSIARPTLWLIGLWLAAALVNNAFFSWSAVMDGASYHPVQAFALSFANLFPVFGLQRSWFAPEFLIELNPWLKAVGGFQTIMSLPLLFFLGLGLRNRFRLR